MLPTIFFILTTALFGGIAVFFSVREEKQKKLLREHELAYKQQLYHITILREIQDRIGYSLDVENVIDVITASLRNLFTYSTASALIITGDRLKFKTYVEETVGEQFIGQVRQGMAASLSALTERPLPVRVEEILSGLVVDPTDKRLPLSYFHIPLVLNDQVVALINISSVKPNLYQEKEMTILYQITTQASNALGRLQNVLSTEKGKLMAMVGSLADGVFMVDVSSQLTIINNSARSFLGLSTASPTIIEVLSAFPHTANLGSKIQQAITQSQPFEEKEIEVNGKVMQIFITPVRNPQLNALQPVLGASVLLHDITLERSVAQMKEDFTNIMVHELRSPLTSIKASTELLANPVGKLTDAEKDKLLELVHDQSAKLLDQVSLILDAAKLNAGLFKVDKTPGDMRRLIEERLEVFMPQAQKKYIQMRADIDPLIPGFMFDQRYIGLVINNLLSNSIKFTPVGGTIILIARRDGNQIMVSVSDNGAGISKEQQTMLFKKFTQVGHASTNVGTGLGLYIVKGVVEAHGGHVRLESEPGHGTTISFTLPVVSPPLHMSQEPPRPLSQALN